jgi:hypothetical protein
MKIPTIRENERSRITKSFKEVNRGGGLISKIIV